MTIIIFFKADLQAKSVLWPSQSRMLPAGEPLVCELPKQSAHQSPVINGQHMGLWKFLCVQIYRLSLESTFIIACFNIVLMNIEKSIEALFDTCLNLKDLSVDSTEI